MMAKIIPRVPGGQDGRYPRLQESFLEYVGNDTALGLFWKANETRHSKYFQALIINMSPITLLRAPGAQGTVANNIVSENCINIVSKTNRN